MRVLVIGGSGFIGTHVVAASLDAAIRRTVAWERATPITGFVPHVFDAAAELAALAAR